MNARDEAPGSQDRMRDYELAWVAEHLPELRASVSPQRILMRALTIGFVAGLAAHIGGYLLRRSITAEPLALIAELLASLGMALWTGVIVVALVQVLPTWQRRAAARWLAAAEDRIATRRPPAPDDPGSGTGQ